MSRCVNCGGEPESFSEGSWTCAECNYGDDTRAADVKTDMWGHSLHDGDDVVVLFPNGNEIEGRYLRPSRGRALVSIGNGTRLYPFGWLSAWGDAKEPNDER